MISAILNFLGSVIAKLFGVWLEKQRKPEPPKVEIRIIQEKPEQPEKNSQQKQGVSTGEPMKHKRRKWPVTLLPALTLLVALAGTRPALPAMEAQGGVEH